MTSDLVMDGPMTGSRKRRCLARLAEERGFTLVEILIATSLLSILITLFSLIMQATVSRSGTISAQATLQTEGRAAVDALAADLRQASCFNTTPPIVAASGSTLTFYSPDRGSPYHMREIFYQLANGSLTRQVAVSANTSGPNWTSWGTMTAGVAAPVVTSITNSIAFDYFDNSTTPVDLSANGAAVTAANLDNIATVEVTLTLVPKSGRGSGSVTVEANVSLRTPTCA